MPSKHLEITHVVQNILATSAAFMKMIYLATEVDLSIIVMMAQ